MSEASDFTADDSAWPDEALRFLARAGRVLGASLDLDETLTDLGRLLVPDLADAVIVQLLDPDGGRPVAEFAHAIPEHLDRLRNYLAEFPPLLRTGSVLSAVARSGTPVVVNHVTESWLRSAVPDNRQYRAFAAFHLSAVIVVPLLARHRVTGAMSLLMTGPDRRFSQRAMQLAEEIGARAALAIDNARLVHSEQRAMNALAESESFLKLAQRAAAMGVWDFAPATGATRWSEEYYRLYGQHLATFVPSYESWLACVHEDDREAVNAVVRDTLEHGTEFRLEFRIRHPARGVRWLLEIGQTMADAGDGTARMTGVTLDITERKQTEERLRQGEKMESIGRLAGGLAHDFNNQLHALSGFTNFVARDPGLGPQARRDLVEIQNAADRMASLTRQLLAFSRQQLLTPETLDLNVAVADTQPMLQRLIGSNIEIRLELAPGAKWVQVDRAQLLQVLMNLAINARDAMPDSGTLTIRTAERAVDAESLGPANGTPMQLGRYVELAVSDSGTGIAADHLPYIFEPFYTTKPVGKGTGLGLATVHGIVQQSRGYLQVDSAAGSGATFTIWLPLADAPEEAAPAPGKEPRANRRQGRVLIVDDEPMVRRIVIRTLELEGYQMAQARHGQEALAVLAELNGAVDLVVSDVVMPVMGGTELAARLRERYPDLPVIWMSGYPSETAFGSGELPDHQPFLQKPVGAELLAKTVHQVIELNAARARLPAVTPRPAPGETGA
jgi:two-component system cell cycle sensor histidine kinase/response regulator CckA